MDTMYVCLCVWMYLSSRWKSANTRNAPRVCVCVCVHNTLGPSVFLSVCVQVCEVCVHRACVSTNSSMLRNIHACMCVCVRVCSISYITRTTTSHQHETRHALRRRRWCSLVHNVLQCAWVLHSTKSWTCMEHDIVRAQQQLFVHVTEQPTTLNGRATRKRHMRTNWHALESWMYWDSVREIGFDWNQKHYLTELPKLH